MCRYFSILNVNALIYWPHSSICIHFLLFSYFGLLKPMRFIVKLDILLKINLTYLVFLVLLLHVLVSPAFILIKLLRVGKISTVVIYGIH